MNPNQNAKTDAKTGRRGRVEAVRERVPDVACKGLCQESCGPVAMSDAEERILRERDVVVGFDRETLTCDQLTPFGRCAVYEDRPLVCRLWGAVPEMPCLWGCATTLPEGVGHELLKMMEAVA